MKITIALDSDQVQEIRALVAAGKAANVSAFVKHAVRVALHDATGWKEMLEDAEANGWSINCPGKGLGRFPSVGTKTEDWREETEGGLNGIIFDAGGLIALGATITGFSL